MKPVSNVFTNISITSSHHLNWKVLKCKIKLLVNALISKPPNLNRMFLDLKKKIQMQERVYALEYVHIDEPE